MTESPLTVTTPTTCDRSVRRSVVGLLSACLMIQSAVYSDHLLADSMDEAPVDVEQLEAEPVVVEAIDVEPISSVVSIDDEPWEFILTPYAWNTYIDGSSTSGNSTSEVDVNVSDILRALNFAFMGQLTVRKGRWGGYINGMYANLDGSNNIGRTDVKAKIEQTLLDFALFYRVGDWRGLEGEGWMPSDGYVDIYVGGRYMNMDLGVDLQSPRFRSDGTLKSVINISKHGRKNWIDPIIGFRTSWNLTREWNVGLQADIGGGANADLTWQGLAVVGHRFGLFAEDDANFLVGYRAVQEKYQEGEGDKKFATNTITHGPILGVGIQF